MIHTLEAIDSWGKIYAFADLVKRCASLKQAPRASWEGTRWYLLKFPDSAPAILVTLRKRPLADVRLEQERAKWHSQVPTLRMPELPAAAYMQSAGRIHRDGTYTHIAGYDYAKASGGREAFKAAAWEMLRQRFADDLAKLGPIVRKL